MKWQRVIRVLIALTAVGFAIAVAMNLQSRPQPQAETPVATTDPKAIVESDSGQTFRINKEQEQLRLEYEKVVTYADGQSKMMGVTVTTERSDRVFTITAKEGQVSDHESVIELTGDVKVTASDGLVVTTARATYTEKDGMARAPGEAQFSRGRMSGSGVGLTYDKNRDILVISDQTHVTVAPDAAGNDSMDVTAGALEFRRPEGTLRFERQAKVIRGAQIVEAETIVGHLSLGEEEQHLETMELRGQSRITASEVQPNGLQALTGQDMDLRYAAGGTAIERALITGDALLQIAGERRQQGRRVSGSTIDLTLAPDGSTLKSLAARENVGLTLPADSGGIGRSITAQTLDGQGDEQHGLTGARFTGGVQFNERGGKVDRVVRSSSLDVAVSPGFATIDDARFSGAVRFADGALSATAALVRYDVSKGRIGLSGSEPASPVPHIVNEQISVDATQIDLALEGPVVDAKGSVKSVLRSKPSSNRGADDVKLPSMLKQDQPVNVTAETLAYQGAVSRADYTGAALLWQGDTQIKAPVISIDGKKGDLAASGQVATVALFVQKDKDGKEERVRSIGTSKTFAYDDASRVATYTEEAHMRGPQGDLTAEKIELLLKASGDELDRVEGYEKVSLQADARKAAGKRLTYFGDEGRYLVSGQPVTIVDACGRQTEGRTLTFFRATDRIIVDGSEQVRTTTKGKSNCPGS